MTNLLKLISRTSFASYEAHFLERLSSSLQLQDKLELELKKHTDEAASKVAAVLHRAEEQGRMIESLHTSVIFFRHILLLFTLAMNDVKISKF